MKKRFIVLVVMAMMAGLTQAALLHHESFESGSGDWTNYLSELTVVGSGTGGISATDGSSYAVISDPDPLPSGYYSGAYSWLGGPRAEFGSGWSSSIDIYIDLADSRIANGSYFFDLSQAISDNTGTAGLQDNIFHVGAADLDEDNDYELAISASHNSGIGQLLSPSNYGGYTSETYPIGEFTQSGWYTFSFDFAVSTEGADSVQVTWDITDSLDNSVWGISWTTEHYALSNAGGNYYMWFCSADTDGLAIDNVQYNGVPEPATLALLGLGGLLIRRKK